MVFVRVIRDRGLRIGGVWRGGVIGGRGVMITTYLI